LFFLPSSRFPRRPRASEVPRLFDEIEAISNDMEEILTFIDDQRAKLSKQKKQRSQEYSMLIIVEQV
jgi:hypothetical protein